MLTDNARFQLIFNTTSGRNSTLSVRFPDDTITGTVVRETMDAIIDSNIFNRSNGEFTSAIGASITDVTYTELDVI